MKKRCKILKLKPAQLALGMEEIFQKVRDLSKIDKGKFKHYIKHKPVSVVIAPNKWLYIVDGHHRALALFMIGEKTVPIKILRDFSKSHVSYPQFWKLMSSRGWTHLYDQYGEGPHDPLYLPTDIRGLGDDPYRSLAWLVEQEGGFEKTKEPFACFQWANFFRQRKILHCQFKKKFKEAKKEALRLARSPACKNLPGYIGQTKHKGPAKHKGRAKH